MKPLKMTAVLLSVALGLSLAVTPVGVVADDSAPSEEQTTETSETEPKETIKPSTEETVAAEPSKETNEDKASESKEDEPKTSEEETPETTAPTEATDPSEEDSSEETKEDETETSTPSESAPVEEGLPEQTAKVSPKNQTAGNPKMIHILDNVSNIYVNIDIPDTDNYSWELNGSRGFIVRYINTGYQSPKTIMLGSAEDAEGYAEKLDMWQGMYDCAHDPNIGFNDNIYKKEFKDGVLLGNDSTSAWFWTSGNYHFVIMVNGSPSDVEKLLGYITVRSGDGIQDANPLSVKSKTATVKYKKLRRKKQIVSVTKVISFTKKGQGKLTYAKVSGNKKITINKSTGKITIKKGLRKKTYKVKVKVRAAGNNLYKPSGWKTVTIKIKVK